jgi:hypothetical protein
MSPNRFFSSASLALAAALPGHEILGLDKGELRIDPSGAFTILSGRWDFFTDGDAANALFCAALK